MHLLTDHTSMTDDQMQHYVDTHDARCSGHGHDHPHDDDAIQNDVAPPG